MFREKIKHALEMHGLVRVLPVGSGRSRCISGCSSRMPTLRVTSMQLHLTCKRAPIKNLHFHGKTMNCNADRQRSQGEYLPSGFHDLGCSTLLALLLEMASQLQRCLPDIQALGTLSESTVWTSKPRLKHLVINTCTQCGSV